MNKELQDLAWSILPKEFKEEVKYYYQHTDSGSYAEDMLESIFGKHNLTSDAEGEEEMLYVSHKKIQEVYRQNKEEINRENVSSSDKDCYEYANEVLKTLFGSKCLPDEKEPKPQSKFHKRDRVKVITDCWKDKVYTVTDVKEVYPQFSYKLSCSPDVWFAESTLELAKEPKPDEPKFKVGDKVKDISSPHDDGIYKVDDIKKNSDGFIYHIQGLIGVSDVKESDLEPYTEPQPATECSNLNKESSTCTDDCSCQDHFVVNNEMVDNIIKDGFSKERRLNIAAKMMQALVCAPLIPGENHNPPAEQLAQTAFRLADALIAEAEKGGSHEKA